MSLREEQCNKVCRILDDVLANRPTERDSLIVATRKAFDALSEPQWIPCSERLPELKKWVLVSSGDCVVSDCLVVRGGNKIWYECGRIDIEHDAWMPLPEPYKGVTE